MYPYLDIIRFQYGCFESFPFHQKVCYFRLPDHVILMKCSAPDFRCQCTQRKVQSICGVLTLLNIFCKRQISIKLFYLYQRLQCTDNYFFKIKFVLFTAACQHRERKTMCLDIFLSVGYRTPVFLSRFLGISILQLLIIYCICDNDMLTLSQ